MKELAGCTQTFGLYLGFPGRSAGKEPACNAGDPNSIPRSGRSAGEGIRKVSFVIRVYFEVQQVL